jgi:tryptophanyl-tRNA synthetase
MKRVLTGIQSSGKPHLGNILGAIKPALELANQANHEAYFFIANLHSLTSLKDAALLKENTLAVAASWLACGLDVERHVFYRQSDIPEVCELAWYLSCLTPYPMLANAHSFKDKSEKLSDVNAGLFTYPVLMAADILMYDAHLIPVGKDQIQHLEMTRDIAGAFNRTYGETFVMPTVSVNEKVMTIPGIDGQKMSKSYNNYIDVFLPEKELKKKVLSILTDSTPLEEPKNPDTCTVFTLFSLMAKPEETAEMRKNYEGGNYGYGHAKNALFELIMRTFSEERKSYDFWINHPEALESALLKGAEKARKTGLAVLKRVRNQMQF